MGVLDSSDLGLTARDRCSTWQGSLWAWFLRGVATVERAGPHGGGVATTDRALHVGVVSERALLESVGVA